jgi:adenylyl cyclase-associated protein
VGAPPPPPPPPPPPVAAPAPAPSSAPQNAPKTDITRMSLLEQIRNPNITLKSISSSNAASAKKGEPVEESKSAKSGGSSVSLFEYCYLIC